MRNREEIAAKAKLDFTNTELTFRNQTNGQLRKSAFLFRFMSHPQLVNVANSLAMSMVRIKFPIAWAVKPTLYKQFVGGETLHECLPALDYLKADNICSILDYSAEADSGNVDYESIIKETTNSINFAKDNDAIPFAVFKPTALANTNVLKKVSFGRALTEDEQKDFQHFKERMNRLAEAAAKARTRLLVDAEDFWYQKAIDDVVYELMQKYNQETAIVFNTWQMYRNDRLDHLKETIAAGRKDHIKIGIKLVRGAYMEKERERALKEGYPSPINPDKAATDHDYNSALELCVENLDMVEVFNGTHNEFSNAFLAGLIVEKGLPKNHPGIWFSQLYGMSNHITSQLASKGYNVTKYVPYGPVNEVLPYLSRRAKENTSVKGQTGRELSMIKKEILRRRSK
ncbi:MAG: proline dehydrogenase [Bacteroidetes bacterium]|nr:MAG: proline dehydrogenase [Bacteroidota bacterium]PIE87716.1 MAG: proline dehydrogenase [Bacteroidota bacterium]